MSKIWLKSLLVSPAALGAALAISASATAAETTVTTESIPADSIVETTQLPITSAELAVPATEVPAISQPETIAPVAPAIAAPQTIAQAVPAAPQTGVDQLDTSSLDQVNRYTREGNRAASMGQVTSVSQLTDVRPTDWAFQALQSLVERYGCIVGYPDRTYRGNRAMTRYEFAAGLNACMDKIQELIAAATGDLVRKEDLLVLQRLQEEFAAELAALRGRVDALEVRTATLERQQFSTTTKLSGEAIFGITSEFGQNDGADNNTVFQDRVRLALNTSFSGKDLLVTRLAAGNAVLFNMNDGPDLVEGTQTFQFGSTGNNDVKVDWLAYYFPLMDDKLQVYIPAVGGLHYDYAPTSAGLMENFDGGNGPLSMFAQRNPIYLIGGGSGLGLTYSFSDAFKLSLGYLADNSDLPGAGGGANVPVAGGGLFNGNYGALAQINFTGMNGNLSVSATYVNAYRKTGIFDGGGGASVVGSGLDNFVLPLTRGAEVNAFGLSAAFKLNPTISINAFGTYLDVNLKGVGGSGDFDAWTYGLGLAFADIGKRGNLLGLMAGVQPYFEDAQNPIHVEAFYKYQLTDNISITPGVIWVINPSSDAFNNGDDAIIGTIRTTFTF
ncbi:iron uptake porin [Pantanalinema rosaneae CENA516]|uniref:iron uptake porin n=1 Tax=Pantanalinema rosaneae TaxID=1620701 RepID=UPI003D6E5446